MSKESYYFPHDYDAQNDPKLQALISKFKALGYGVYWAIIEMLHKEENHKLPLKDYIFVAIGKQMLANAKQVEAIIDFAIKDCELFIENEGFFYSKRVLKNFERRAEISEKRSKAGYLGAIAKQNLAKSSKGKKRKGNKSKGDIIIPEYSEFLEYAKTLKSWQNGFEIQLEAKYNAWKGNGWYDGNSNFIGNWKTKLQNTIVYFKPVFKTFNSEPKPEYLQ